MEHSSSEGRISIEVPLDKALLARVRERAELLEQDIAVYIEDVLRKELARPLSVDEVLAPFRREVEASGMTDEELGGLFGDLLAKVRNQRRANTEDSS